MHYANNLVGSSNTFKVPLEMEEKHRNFEGLNSYRKFSYRNLRNKGLNRTNSFKIPMEMSSSINT
jgi:hypothetical protein